MDPFSTVVLVLSIASIVWLGWMVSRGNANHNAEDEARAFFDEHGRWPDDEPAPH